MDLAFILIINESGIIVSTLHKMVIKFLGENKTIIVVKT